MSIDLKEVYNLKNGKIMKILKGFDIAKSIKQIKPQKIAVAFIGSDFDSYLDDESIEEEDILTVGNDGKLAVAESAPGSGVYFTVTKTGIRLTEAAFEVKVCVADATE